jgi:hypothetical protein
MLTDVENEVSTGEMPEPEEWIRRPGRRSHPTRGHTTLGCGSALPAARTGRFPGMWNSLSASTKATAQHDLTEESKPASDLPTRVVYSEVRYVDLTPVSEHRACGAGSATRQDTRLE